MRRRLVMLAMAATVAVGATLAGAGPAAADPGGNRSVHSCTGHPGQHKGSDKWNPSTERRNVGGTCPV